MRGIEILARMGQGPITRNGPGLLIGRQSELSLRFIYRPTKLYCLLSRLSRPHNSRLVLMLACSLNEFRTSIVLIDGLLTTLLYLRPACKAAEASFLRRYLFHRECVTS